MNIKSIKIQTWIRTIAEIIAIVGGSAAIIKLFIADKDIQYQIQELKTMSSQAVEQTKEFKKQNELIKLRNDLEFEQVKNQEMRWKKDILPSFAISANSFELSATWFSTRLINTGRMAKIIGVIKYNDNTYKFNIPNTLVGENAGIEFNVENTGNGIKQPKLHFTISFEDLDGNKYNQTFITKEINGEIILTTSQPEKIK